MMSNLSTINEDAMTQGKTGLSGAHVEFSSCIYDSHSKPPCVCVHLMFPYSL